MHHVKLSLCSPGLNFTTECPTEILNHNNRMLGQNHKQFILVTFVKSQASISNAGII